MLSFSNLSNMLRSFSEVLLIPVMVILLLLIAVTVIMLGTLIAEGFTERLQLRAKLPGMADRLKAGEEPSDRIIETSGLLKRQKKALLEVTKHPRLSPSMRESLAAELIFEEREHYNSIVRVTDIIARTGPMFGLLGTLIPLGPGIIALGRGDTYTLSMSFLTAFDTTIAGLASAVVALIISAVRKKWYARYMTGLEMVMECLLEAEDAQYHDMEAEEQPSSVTVLDGGGKDEKKIRRTV